MNIHEYQAKQVLKGYRVPVAKGIPAFTIDEAVQAAEDAAVAAEDAEDKRTSLSKL